MYLKKLNVDHFGKFHNEEIKLDRSVNVIYGSNEAGKTTIHKFIEGILFGFFKQNTKKKIYSSEYSKYLPWIGSQYCGSILYNYKNNDYRLERNLLKGKDSIKLYDDVTGEDITEKAQYNSVSSLYEPADIHFGINRTVYKNTLSVGQLGVRTDKEFSGEIKEILVNMQESKSEDVSVTKAVKNLTEKMNKIGTSKAKRSRLGEIYQKIEELEKELSVSEYNYEQVYEIQAQINQLNTLKEQIVQKIKILDEDIGIIKNEGYKKQYKEAEKINNNISTNEEKLKELEKFKSVNENLFEKVVEHANNIKNLEEEIIKNETELEPITLEKNRIEKNLNELSMFKNKDEHVFEDIRVRYETYKSLKEKISEKIQRKKSIQKELDKTKEVSIDLNEDYYRYEELEKNEIKYTNIPDSLNIKRDEYKKAVQKQKRNTIFSAISIFVLLSGVVLGIFIENLLFSIALAGAVFLVTAYVFGRRSLLDKKQKAEEYEKEKRCYEEEKVYITSEMEKILRRNGVTDPIGLKRKFISYSTFAARKTELIKDKEELDEQIDKAFIDIQDKESEMASVIALFYEDNEINGDRIDDVDKKHKEYKKMKNELVHISENEDKIKKNIEDAKRELYRSRIILDKIFTDNDTKTFEEYKQSVEMKKKYMDFCNNIKSEKKLLEQVLNGNTIEEIKGRIKEGLSAERSEGYDLETAELQKKKILSEVSDLNIDRSKLEERIMGIEKNNRLVVDVVSDLEYNNKQREELEKKIKSYSIAIETISELSVKVRNSFAPKLNKEINNILKIMTSGKYDNIKVDSDMGIKVVDNDLNNLVDIEDLSVGTIDQIYFALRFSILKLIKEDDKLPLLLDDCFVNYDNQRLAEILKYIHAEAVCDKRQILLFTCHDREIEALKHAELEFNLVIL